MDFEPDPPIMAELMQWCLNRKPGRDAQRHRVPVLLRKFADIYDGRWPIITVAGTSGKGTTCAMLEAVLIEAGHVPGIMTKPHLFAYRERFSIAGRWVSTRVLEDHTRRIFARLQQVVAKLGPDFHPSLFESLLLIGGSIFNERGVTIAVIEAAVGGNNDASSLFPAEVSVLTSVSLDHQNELGNSIEAIARDKAGIAQPGSTLVMGAALSQEARSFVLAENLPRKIRCIQADVMGIEVMGSGKEGQELQFVHQEKEIEIKLPFVGEHQLKNFATVWMLTKILHEEKQIKTWEAIRGVKNARIPGRFEIVQGNPSWLLDVAHNVASMRALIKTVTQFFSRKQIIVILGATEPHDYRGFVKLLEDWGVTMGFCEGFPKAVAGAILAARLSNKSLFFGQFAHLQEAIIALRNNPTLKDKTILVTGSLFLVGQWRHELFRQHLLPPRKEG